MGGIGRRAVSCRGAGRKSAIPIRAYGQRRGFREAVVAGGGLLGLEAGHSLSELGLRVTILERGERLMSKQIDEHCGGLVDAYSRWDAGAPRPRNRGDTSQPVREVILKDRRRLRCGVFLAAMGIQPKVELARRAGIAVNRGIVVDDRMETFYLPGCSPRPATLSPSTTGACPRAVADLAKQGEVAAVNALGGDLELTSEVPATILKGVGLDLFSIGRPAAQPDDQVVVDEDPDPAAPSYRRLVLSGGRAVGGVVLGNHPEDVAAVTAAVENRLEVSPAQVAELRRGNWGAARGFRPASQRRPTPSTWTGWRRPLTWIADGEVKAKAAEVAP